MLGACYLGFALLALAQARHWARVTAHARPPGRLRVRLLQGAGSTALAGSLLLALLRDGASFGALLWVTALSVAATAVAFTLTWRARWLRPLALAFADGRIADGNSHQEERATQ